MLTRGLRPKFNSILLLMLAWNLSLEAENSPSRFALANSDEDLVFEAGASAPKLTGIHGRSGLFRNGLEESLPASVETDGASVPTQWQFQPQLSRATSHEVILVYETQNPRLRLSWSWESRARSGPMEHEITVKNLSAREIWLPFSIRSGCKLTIRRPSICGTSMSKRAPIVHRLKERISTRSSMGTGGRANRPPMRFPYQAKPAKLFLWRWFSARIRRNLAGTRGSSSAEELDSSSSAMETTYVLTRTES